jgi:hypothetical protein
MIEPTKVRQGEVKTCKERKGTKKKEWVFDVIEPTWFQCTLYTSAECSWKGKESKCKERKRRNDK